MSHNIKYKLKGPALPVKKDFFQIKNFKQNQKQFRENITI